MYETENGRVCSNSNQLFKNVSSKKEQIPYEKEQLAVLE